MDAGIDAADAAEAGPLPGTFGGSCDADAGTGCPGDYTCWGESVPGGTYGTCVVVCGGPAGHDPTQAAICVSLGYTCESMTALIDGCWKR